MPTKRQEALGSDSVISKMASESGAGNPVHQVEDFGYEIPVETVPLPSQGKIYPSGHPLHNKETVQIRAMTAREEDILMSRAFIKNGTVITNLLRSCLSDKTIDPDDMIAGDRNAILIAIRITGYGPDYDVESSCPSCGNRQKSTFNLASLPIKRLSVDPVVPGENEFEVSLPVTKSRAVVKFTTGHDDRERSTTQERLQKAGIQGESLVTSRLQSSIVSINGRSEGSFVTGFIRNMPARDSLVVRKFLEANEPGIDMSSGMTCNSCDAQEEVRIPMGAAFFWPDA
tara:strand:- start:2147 stop:3004 length:858 start_codon:yes stop_codon:yes gene_type:complete